MPKLLRRFYFLVLAAFFLRALIPAGYMPETGTRGFAITLCSMDGPKTIILDLGHKNKSSNEKITDHALACPYAAMAALAPPASALTKTMEPGSAGTLRLAFPHSVIQQQRYGPLGARAPPSNT